MAQDLQADVEAVSRIEAVPTILEVVCRTTGMGFAAVARVTEDRWLPAAYWMNRLRPQAEWRAEDRDDDL
jgi:hypothetical protein